MIRCSRYLPFFSAVICCWISAYARIGETAIECANRYGPPKDTPSSKVLDKNSPILEGAIHHTYEYQGWKIRAAFLQLDGTAARMEYSKLGTSPQIKDYELQAIITANTPPGTSWKQVPYNNPDLQSKGVTKPPPSAIVSKVKI